MSDVMCCARGVLSLFCYLVVFRAGDQSDASSLESLLAQGNPWYCDDS
jgi:hypothetical protein